jgi:Zn-dependent protease
MGEINSIILNLALWAVPVILAITLHEAAHGYVAKLFGDPTAYLMGRITLNPFKHVDLWGTILIPGGIVIFNVLSGVNFPPFGWAKPVPVNFSRLRKPKADMLWVAAAGPGSNLVQAFAWVVILRVLGMFLSPESLWLELALNGVLVNLSLMVLNLVPVPPLDGGRILVSLLPMPQAVLLSRLEPYGFYILIALLYFHILDHVMGFVLPPLFKLLLMLTGA